MPFMIKVISSNMIIAAAAFSINPGCGLDIQLNI